MDMFFSAKRQSLNEFLTNFHKENIDDAKLGSPLIFHAMSNNDPTNRYEIVKFLIDEGVNLNVSNAENETLFHVLFSRQKQSFEETIILAKFLLDAEVDINHLDSKNRVAFQWLINSKYSDKELTLFYDWFFSNKKLVLSVKNDWGFSPIDLIQKNTSRVDLLKRINSYE